MEYIAGLTEAIRALFTANEDRSFTLKEVYVEIGDTDLLQLPKSAREITYNQPKFQHSVRTIIAWLVGMGELRKVARGTYQKA